METRTYVSPTVICNITLVRRSSQRTNTVMLAWKGSWLSDGEYGSWSQPDRVWISTLAWKSSYAFITLNFLICKIRIDIVLTSQSGY